MEKNSELGHAKNSESNSFYHEWYLPPESKDDMISANRYGIDLWVPWQLSKKENLLKYLPFTLSCHVILESLAFPYVLGGIY